VDFAGVRGGALRPRHARNLFRLAIVKELTSIGEVGKTAVIETLPNFIKLRSEDRRPAISVPVRSASPRHTMKAFAPPPAEA
jgi:hypothetical protein